VVDIGTGSSSKGESAPSTSAPETAKPEIVAPAAPEVTTAVSPVPKTGERKGSAEEPKRGLAGFFGLFESTVLCYILFILL